MKRQIKKYLPILRIIGSILGLGLVFFQVYKSRHYLISFFQTFGQNSNLFFSFLIILVAIIIQISIWFMIMRLFDVRIKYFEALLGYSLAFLPKYIPGTFWGYLSRNEWLNADFGIERKTSTLASAFELFFIAGATAFMAGLYYLPQSLLGYFVLFVIILASEILLLHLFQRKPINLPFLSSAALKPIPSLKILVLNLSSIGVWFVYGLGIFFLSTDRPIAMINLDWLGNVFQYGVSFSLAWLTGFLVLFVPSGIGIREGVLANLISVNEGWAIGKAYQIALVFRLVISVSEISLALLGIILKSIKRVRNS
jgi:hypothetical protein